MRMQGILFLVIILAVGYVLGVKFPGLAAKVGIA
jgi:hypothetical protein